VFYRTWSAKFKYHFDSKQRVVKIHCFINLDPRKSWIAAVQVLTMLHQVGSFNTRLGDGWITLALPAMDEIDGFWIKALIRLLKSAGGRDYMNISAWGVRMEKRFAQEQVALSVNQFVMSQKPLQVWDDDMAVGWRFAYKENRPPEWQLIEDQLGGRTC